MRYTLAIALAAAVLAIGFTNSASARIKLTTLPDRERVIVRFEDTGHVLVEESRTITLDKGMNQVDFTWLGVDIDRSSIQLLPVGGKGLNVIRTTYPPNEGNSLVWDVAAAQAGPVQVRIAYLLRGLSRELSWRAVVTDGAGENGKPLSLALRLDQRLANNSGEDFDRAKLQAAFGELKRESPLASGEVRQQLVASYATVPFEKRYTYDPDQKGEVVTVDYVMTNSAERGLGGGLLPGGKVRIFQATGETEAFMGEDWAQPTALGEEMKLGIGQSKDLTVRRAVMDSKQEVLQRDHQGRPALWNQVSVMRWEVENFTNETKTIQLVQRMNGEWDVVEPVQTLEKRIAPEKYEPAAGEKQEAGKLERKDANTLIINVPVPKLRRVVFTANLRQLNLH